jgi:hypothetical protein
MTEARLVSPEQLRAASHLPRRHAELVSASISYAAACPAAPLLHAIRAPRANRRHGLWILKRVQDDGGEACVPGAVARRLPSPRRHAEPVSASISCAAACPAAPLLHAIRAPRVNRRHGLWILKQVQDDGGEACIPGAVARRLPSPRRHAEPVSASISSAAACPAAPLLHAIRVPRANRRHGLWILKQVQDDGGEACVPEQLRAASHPHIVMLNSFQHPYPVPLLVLSRRCSTLSAPRAPIGDMGYGS